jgi:hypothetical protein
MIGTLAAIPSTNVSVLLWKAGSLMAAMALANEGLIGPDMMVEGVQGVEDLVVNGILRVMIYE